MRHVGAPLGLLALLLAACGDAPSRGGICASAPLSAPELAERGDRLFASPRPVTGVAAPSRVRLADVDSDGRAELLVASGVGLVRLAYREGRDDYAPAAVAANGGSVFDFDVGDLDGDGRADVITNEIASFTAAVVVSWGSGAPRATLAFPAARVRMLPPRAGRPARALLHRIELVAFMSGEGGALTLGGLVDAEPPLVAEPTVRDEPQLGDWDGDGQLDVAIVRREPQRALIEVLPGDADAPGGYGPSALLPIGDLVGVVTLRTSTGDVLLVVHRLGERTMLEVWGGRPLAPQVVSSLDVDTIQAVAAADLDGDGVDEVVLSAISTYVLARALDGTLGLIAALRGQSRVVGPEARGDVDGDGRQDLVLQRPGGLELVRAIGTLPAPLCTLPADGAPSAVADRPTSFTVHPGESVQAAVDAVAPRGTVTLAPGDHAGPVVVPRALVLRGAGRDATRLLTPDGQTGITLLGGASRIEGLQIEGAPSTVGVSLLDGAALIDCDLRGHGIAAVIHSFSSDETQAMRIDRCALRGNGRTAGSAAVVMAQGRLALTNTILWDNHAAFDLSMTELVAVNNTVAENDFASLMRVQGLTLLNNVHYRNGSRADTLEAVQAHVDYNIMRPTALGAGPHDVDGDPLFTDPDGGDFTLLPGSPAIGTGTTAGAPAVDHRGRPRPHDGPIDRGALQR